MDGEGGTFEPAALKLATWSWLVRTIRRAAVKTWWRESREGEWQTAVQENGFREGRATGVLNGRVCVCDPLTRALAS